MKRSVVIALILTILLTGFGCAPDIQVSELKCNFKEDPTGINRNPHFSWILFSDVRNQFQSAYHLLVSDNPESLRKNIGNIWDTQQVRSEQSILISYAGKPLKPGTEYFWKVKVWDKNGNESEWSRQTRFATGLFDKEDWSGAQWIGYEDIPDSLVLVPGVHLSGNNLGPVAVKRPVIPMFRKEFSTNEKIKSAYLFISGLGHYKAYINGREISNDFLSPGWTDYRKKCLYNTYDITQHIIKGRNAIGVVVGNGFHNINRERYRKLVIAYGMPKLIAKINITYTDGSRETIITNSNWKTAPSPVIYSSIFGGEDYDARLEQAGWNTPGFNDREWKDALPVKDPGGELCPETTYPIQILETFKPVNIIKLGSDTFLYDFGQNASGIVKLKVRGEKSRKIKLIPGELIDERQFVNQRATGRPYYFEYTLKGNGEETWQPLFSYYGFRYVQVEGAVPREEKNSANYPEIVELNSLHTYNSTPRVGKFTTSNDFFNRINKLILYAIQSNLQSVVTDCPHREKLGWLEQTYLMGGSIHYNFDLYHLYRKQVEDMIYTQTADGLIPDIAPEYVNFGDNGFRDSPEWGSAGVILPWLIYKWYGNKSIMEKAWPMMLKYIDYLGRKADGHILSYGLGDWYDLGPERPGFAQLTPVELTATAIYYYDVTLMAKMAGMMNYSEEKQRLDKLADEIKKAFNSILFDPVSKVYSTGSQTAMAMPLCVGLVNDEDKDLVFNNLVDSIYTNGKALTAGDIGFHYLIEALMQGGASQLVYEMNNRDDIPGYGYQLKKGATALTESWAALRVVSNNHLMLGHIMEWFYKGLGGIQQEEGSAAYKEIVIKPALVGDFSEVRSSYISPYGPIKTGWKRMEDMIRIAVEIPVNTTARVYLPSGDPDRVEENAKPIRNVPDIRIGDTEKNRMIIETGSGSYNFEIKIGK